MRLGTILVEEHILSILPDKWRANVRDSNPVDILEQGKIPAIAFLTTKDTENMANKIFYETGNTSENCEKYLFIVRVHKQLVPESLYLTVVRVTTVARVLLCFYPDYDLTIRECLAAKDIVKAFLKRSYFISVTNTVTKPQKVDKHKVSGRPTDGIYKIITIESHTFEDPIQPNKVIKNVATGNRCQSKWHFTKR